MSDSNIDELQKRIRKLEQKVQRLEDQISQSGEVKEHEPINDRAYERRNSQQRSVDKQSQREWADFRIGEQWLNRIGIGLLLIGVAFLFKYSIDQGWLIPPVRSAIGLGIGMVLFGIGLQMRESVKPLKQILLGGGIAVFYITGFATFQLYSFVPSSIVWTFMVVVTLLSLSLSLQQDEAVLSVVGTLGAFGTPFMLYTGSGSVIMLMIYTLLILFATAIMYMKKGWKSLLWSITIGGALVLFVALINTTFYEQTVTLHEHWVMQIGAFGWMLATWILPVYRDILSANNPDYWIGSIEGNHSKSTNFLVSSSVHLMTFVTPLFILGFVMSHWELSMNNAGLASFGLAGVGAIFYWLLSIKELSKLASTHGLLALSMLTIGLTLMLEGNVLFTALAVEAIALRFIASETSDVKVNISSHVLFGIVFLWLLNKLYYSLGDPASILAIESLSQLGVIAAGGLLVPLWLKAKDTRQVYQLTSHIVLLLWMYQKLIALQNGHAFVTVAWGIYAIALLVWGFAARQKGTRITGMATIFLVVGKLFFVDLSQLDAVWRILLFMGFGAIFLLLGYYWQSKWSKDETKVPGQVD